MLPVEYVNTRDNDVADLESRELDLDDWRITDDTWLMIEGAFGPHDWDRFVGPHDWDRFASMENRRCRRYTANGINQSATGRRLFRNHGRTWRFKKAAQGVSNLGVCWGRNSFVSMRRFECRARDLS